jgi:AcrR family transcriptional regulator
MNAAKTDEKSATRQQILQVTLQLLETQGAGQVTIRKIAAQAGVNVAAVNYHFGSKEQVIYQALQILRSRFAEAFDHLRDTATPPRQRLIAFMTVYCDAVFAYPNLVKAFVNQNLNVEFQREYASFVQADGLALITHTLGEILPAGNEETLRMKAFQMMSSLILILLVGQDTAPIIGLDFRDPDVRARYIQMIVPI